MRVGENNYKIIGISDYLDDKLEVDGTESYGRDRKSNKVYDTM